MSDPEQKMRSGQQEPHPAEQEPHPAEHEPHPAQHEPRLPKDARPIVVHLDYAPPLDWDFFLQFMKPRLIPSVEAIKGDVYERVFASGREIGRCTVYNDARSARLVVSVYGADRRRAELMVRRIRFMFDLDADQDAIQAVLGADPWIGPIVRSAPGLRVPRGWSAYEAFVRTIIGQQVTVKAAGTLMNRLIRRIGGTTSPETDTSLPIFLSPGAVADADLTSIGMPSRRVQALQNASRLIAEKRIPFPHDVSSGDVVSDRTNTNFYDHQAVRDALLELPGIGPWTVELFSLRGLGDADAWPGTDLILRRSLDRIIAEAEPSSRTPSSQGARPQSAPSRPAPPADGRSQGASAKSVSDGWRPYRAYAAMYLWHRAVRDGAEKNNRQDS